MAACVAWVGSYVSATAALGELPRGAWRLIARPGQAILVHHHRAPEPWTPGSWGTTTVRLSDDGQGALHALMQGLVYEPQAVWVYDGRPQFATHRRPPGPICARPYALVSLSDGLRVSNFGGFGLTVLQFPAQSLPPGVRVGRVLESVAVPYWFIVAATFILPSQAMGRWLNDRRRQAAGRCRQCGYDLRATRERCPECGTACGA